MYKKVILALTLMATLVVCAITITLAYNFVGNFGDTAVLRVIETTIEGVRETPRGNAAVISVEGNTAGVSAEITAVPTRFYTITPINDVATLVGHEVDMRDFIFHEELRDLLHVEILYPPIDWNSPGQFEAVLNVVQSGTSAREFATIYIFAPPDRAQLEVGSDVNALTPYDFLTEKFQVSEWTHFQVEIISELEGLTDELGEGEVSLVLNGIEFTIPVDIVDTTPPTVVLRDVTVRVGREISPWDFVVSANDISPPVLVSFYEMDDVVFSPGTHDVTIKASDYFNNSAFHTAVLTVLPNIVPPLIIGATDIDVIIGTSVTFRQGVYAEDAFGVSLEFFVDSGAVNVHEFGSYPVVYYTYDSGGLRTEVTVFVHVIDVDTPEVRERAAEILAEILNDEMTQVQQARAIFDWISANVSYAAGFEPQSIYEGANMAFTHRRGDCFVFASVSEVMLNIAGVPNRRVNRYGGQNRHAWNLINPDEMGWYHFDTTPVRVGNINRFMFTESQAREFTRIIYNQVRERNYFTFDASLHPEVVYE